MTKFIDCLQTWLTPRYSPSSMRSNARFRIILLAFIGLIPSLLAGCAAFPQHQVPLIEPATSIPKIQHKPSAIVDTQALGPCDTSLIHMKTDHLTQTINETGLINALPASKAPNADIHLKVTIYCSEFHSRGTDPELYVCAFTLTVIPCYSSVQAQVVISAVDKDGRETATTSNSDTTHIWAGWAMWPIASSHDPVKIEQDMLDNQIRSAMFKLFASGALNAGKIERPSI